MSFETNDLVRMNIMFLAQYGVSFQIQSLLLKTISILKMLKINDICQLTREPLNLNGGNDEVVEGELLCPGVVFGEQILDKSWGKPISHLLES